MASADAEGWICENWEFEFLLRVFPHGCLVARETGKPIGFITSVKYGTSGWVGNLIVRPALRGMGVGNTLMKKVLASLAEAGARTVWLTASAEGKPVYERLGFVEFDTIKRWRGAANSPGEPARDEASVADIMAIDMAGWGDIRQPILEEVAKRGTTFVRNGGFLVKQPCGEAFQFGPWGATERQAAASLLATALAQTATGTHIFLDVPVGNVDAAALLHTAGFTIRGSTTLMCLGEPPVYVPARIYALASMGSMG